MIIFDTDVLSIVQRATALYERLAEQLDAADEEVVVTIVSFEEQMPIGLFGVAGTGPLFHAGRPRGLPR